MNTSIILQTITQRRSYPVMGKYQDSEIKYAKEILQQANNTALLIFPVGTLVGTSQQSQSLRKMMLDGWNIGGVFDIGSIFEPATAIRYSLIFLTKQKNQNIHFGIFSGKLFSSVPKYDIKNPVLGELPKISSEFKSYIEHIESVVGNRDTPGSTDIYRFFVVGVNDFDKDHFNIEYYDPDLVENENQ